MESTRRERRDRYRDDHRKESRDRHRHRRHRSRSRERRSKQRSRSQHHSESRYYPSEREEGSRERRGHYRSRRRQNDRGRSLTRDESESERSLSWSPPPAVRRQMAEAKAKREREAAEGFSQTEKTGKFWDGFRWVEHTKASQIPSNPATRKERRLYIGNLPDSFDATKLRIFLNEALAACGAIPKGLDEVVISCWVSPDNKFSFVELATVEAATTALGLSGLACLGSNLKICYPNNYVLGSSQALALQAAFGISTMTSGLLGAPIT